MKIKPAYANSGQTNPGSVPSPISLLAHSHPPPFFFNVRVMRKGNHISKLGKQTALFFSVKWPKRVPHVLFRSHPLRISSSPSELEGLRVVGSCPLRDGQPSFL